jgi:ubiquinone/menaquinone biosynthesis C-methylase UbiE
LEFLSYDGEAFPFPEDYFDIVVTRYAIHHFPDIEHCFSELSRVLKSNGQLFISDPTPNKLDINRFVDKYMQMKDDGHIQFYTLEEITKIAKKFGFEKRFTTLTKIRFPRKNATKYSNLLDGAGIETLQLYEIETIKDEIFISEDVLNISFEKE